MRRILDIVVVIVLFASLAIVSHAADQKPYKNYQEAEEISTAYYNQQDYKGTIRVLKMAELDFPEKYDEIVWWLGVSYCLDGQAEQALAIFKEAVGRDVCLPDPGFYNFWEPLEKFPEFKKLRERNGQLRQLAQNTAKPTFEVVLPSGYDRNKPYPLFIALHGWGGNNPSFRMYWKSEALAKDFILVYMQSSQVVRTNGYSWDDIDTARKDILSMFESVSKGYTIDKERIYIGGFSQGGKTALDIAIEQTLPVKGFVLLCPGGGIPTGLNDPAAIARARQNKLRAVILTGDKDPSLPEQQEIVAALKKSAIPYRFTITPNLYHYFPTDFPHQLDTALTFLSSQSEVGEQ